MLNFSMLKGNSCDCQNTDLMIMKMALNSNKSTYAKSIKC